MVRGFFPWRWRHSLNARCCKPLPNERRTILQHPCLNKTNNVNNLILQKTTTTFIMTTEKHITNEDPAALGHDMISFSQLDEPNIGYTTAMGSCESIFTMPAPSTSFVKPEKTAVVFGSECEVFPPLDNPCNLFWESQPSNFLLDLQNRISATSTIKCQPCPDSSEFLFNDPLLPSVCWPDEDCSFMSSPRSSPIVAKPRVDTLIASYTTSPDQIKYGFFVVHNGFPWESVVTDKGKLQRIRKWKAKKQRMLSRPLSGVLYDVRKKVADSRVRVGGRFVSKKKQLELLTSPPNSN